MSEGREFGFTNDSISFVPAGIDSGDIGMLLLLPILALLGILAVIAGKAVLRRKKYLN